MQVTESFTNSPQLFCFLFFSFESLNPIYRQSPLSPGRAPSHSVVFNALWDASDVEEVLEIADLKTHIQNKLRQSSQPEMQITPDVCGILAAEHGISLDFVLEAAAEILFRQGIPPGAVAQRLGLSYNQVSKWWKRMNNSSVHAAEKNPRRTAPRVRRTADGATTDAAITRELRILTRNGVPINKTACLELADHMKLPFEQVLPVTAVFLRGREMRELEIAERLDTRVLTVRSWLGASGRFPFKPDISKPELNSEITQALRKRIRSDQPITRATLDELTDSLSISGRLVSRIAALFLHNRGMTPPQIVQQFNIADSTVLEWLEEFKIERRPQRSEIVSAVTKALQELTPEGTTTETCLRLADDQALLMKEVLEIAGSLPQTRMSPLALSASDIDQVPDGMARSPRSFELERPADASITYPAITRALRSLTGHGIPVNKAACLELAAEQKIQVEQVLALAALFLHNSGVSQTIVAQRLETDSLTVRRWLEWFNMEQASDDAALDAKIADQLQNCVQSKKPITRAVCLEIAHDQTLLLERVLQTAVIFLHNRQVSQAEIAARLKISEFVVSSFLIAFNFGRPPEASELTGAIIEGLRILHENQIPTTQVTILELAESLSIGRGLAWKTATEFFGNRGVTELEIAPSEQDLPAVNSSIAVRWKVPEEKITKSTKFILGQIGSCLESYVDVFRQISGDASKPRAPSSRLNSRADRDARRLRWFLEMFEPVKESFLSVMDGWVSRSKIFDHSEVSAIDWLNLLPTREHALPREVLQALKPTGPEQMVIREIIFHIRSLEGPVNQLKTNDSHLWRLVRLLSASTGETMQSLEEFLVSATTGFSVKKNQNPPEKSENLASKSERRSRRRL